MRNENGSGSVCKLSGKRRKPWLVRVTEGYDIEGRQLRKVVGTFATKREAQEALFRYIKSPALFSKKNFGEIKDAWYEIYKKRITSKTTISTLNYRLRYFEPIEKRSISDIRLFELQKLFDDMDTSWSFKNGCKSALNMIFDFALKNDFVDSNKIKFIEIGKKDKVIQRKIFSSEEIDALWRNIDMSHVYVVLLLIYTGMRIGELRNLRNRDIDFEKRTITVKESKTSAGVRVVPLSSRAYKLIIDNLKEDQEYFVKGATTDQLPYPTFKDRFQKIMKDLDLYPHTIHDTRHTFATMLNNANANPTSITRLIGHSDFSTTENIYTHKDTEELRKAIELIC